MPQGHHNIGQVKENGLLNHIFCCALKQGINYHSTDCDKGLKGSVGLSWPILCLYLYLSSSEQTDSTAIKLWEGWDIFWVHWPELTNTTKHCHGKLTPMDAPCSWYTVRHTVCCRLHVLSDRSVQSLGKNTCQIPGCSLNIRVTIKGKHCHIN